ncbi:MAG: signal peptidase I [Eubacteriales bacterium]|nr:signal peptidase I [Eubacteriales bacterium]
MISWLQVIVTAAIIAFVLNTFVIANSEVPTGSMEPTINEHNRVIGSRLSYTFGEPDRGDIAIFKFGWICEHCKKAMGEGEPPEICPLCGKKITKPKTLYYVKRVIGMPGDVIEIKQEGSVKASELSEIPPGLVDSPSDDAELATAAVYVNGEKITEDYLKEPMLYTGDMHFEVPENCYFMMGDNRNNSRDARFWNNPYISDEKMVAKVLFRYFPNPSLLK